MQPNSHQKSRRRFAVLGGAALVQLCVGAIYTWSLFNRPLAELHGWRPEAVLWAYAVNILTFALTTMVSGRLQDRFGPRPVASAGALALGAGVFLTGGAGTLTEVYLWYGLLAGIGVGLVYPCPLATCIKWFPDHKGLVTGIAVGAFGLGGLVFKDLILHLLDTQGVVLTFRYLGGLYLALVLAGAQLLQLPQGLSRPDRAGTPAEGLRAVVASGSFARLWTSFFFGTLTGLLLLGMAKDMGASLAGMCLKEAAHLVGVASLSNAVGRLSYGFLSDRLDRWRLIGAINLLTACAVLILALAPVDGRIFTAALIVIVSGFGGLLAIYPALTAETFGVASLGRNYGLIFAAYGLAAFFGPLVSAWYPLRTVLGACAAAALFAGAAGFLASGGKAVLRGAAPPEAAKCRQGSSA